MAYRLSVAPMMDWTENSVSAEGWWPFCAARVQAEIAKCRISAHVLLRGLGMSKAGRMPAGCCLRTAAAARIASAPTSLRRVTRPSILNRHPSRPPQARTSPALSEDAEVARFLGLSGHRRQRPALQAARGNLARLRRQEPLMEHPHIRRSPVDRGPDRAPDPLRPGCPGNDSKPQRAYRLL